MNCFGCGGEGHLERNCPSAEFTSGPYWCGICDKRTRLVRVPGYEAARCPDCHPKRHEHLQHLQRCPACHMLIHDWDSAPCGQHSSPVAPDRRPPAAHIREITGRAT